MSNVSSWTDLNNMRNNLSGTYTLTKNLLATDDDYEGIGDDWTPIGTNANKFTGSFDGMGFKINNLIINKPTTDYVGLFGAVQHEYPASLTRVWLVSVNITGQDQTGGIVGAGGRIYRSYTTGTVVGRNYVGGIVGGSTIIYNSFSVATVSGNNAVGGLVGVAGSIEQCYAAGDVTGVGQVGGFAGENYGFINQSFSTGRVTGSGSNVGGFAGNIYGMYSYYPSTSGWFYTPGYATQPYGSEITLMDYNVKVGGGSGWIDDSVDYFYNKNITIYTNEVQPWDFTTIPIWYENINDFPKLYPAEALARTKGPLPMFKRI